MTVASLSRVTMDFDDTMLESYTTANDKFRAVYENLDEPGMVARHDSRIVTALRALQRVGKLSTATLAYTLLLKEAVSRFL